MKFKVSEDERTVATVSKPLPSQWEYACRVFGKRFLTDVEFGDGEHFSPANHIFPLNEMFKGVCSLSGRDELWAQEPARERR